MFLVHFLFQNFQKHKKIYKTQIPKIGGKPTEEIISVQILPFEFRWLVPLGRSHQPKYQTLERCRVLPKFLTTLTKFLLFDFQEARKKP